jgi:hypothetical protein
MAAEIVDLIQHGELHIARLRTAGLAAMPTLAGVVMMLGMVLRREGAV